MFVLRLLKMAKNEKQSPRLVPMSIIKFLLAQMRRSSEIYKKIV